MRRRDFIRLGSVLAGASIQSAASAEIPVRSSVAPPTAAVDFLHDGLSLSPKEYAQLLMKLADEGKIKPDYYSNEGVVEELENKFAQLTGKESAVFLPTGTLANHIAIRKHAGLHSRVAVQEQSHLYNDSGDCAQVLSGLNLLPLGVNNVEFSLTEIEEQFTKAKTGRVITKLACISIETPVRRKFDRMFTFANIQQVSEYARKNDIKMHFDGARLFVQSAHTGKSPSEYSALFDTVYTSLWKCFNAASGAVLCGSKSFTNNLFHERRMFGGSLPAAWPFAAVALYYADGFMEEYKNAWQHALRLFANLRKDPRFEIIELEGGSHIVRLNVKDVDLAKFRTAMFDRNIELPAPDAKGFYLKVNPSINRSPDLSAHFIDCLKLAANR